MGVAMGSLSQILQSRNRVLHIQDPHQTVEHVIRLMAREHIGAVPVCRAGALVGIFSERDFLRRIALEGRTSREPRLAEMMVSRLVCVDPSSSLEDCLAIMTQKRIRHLPVMEQGKLAGIVSIGDLVKFISAAQEMEIRYLNDYITGKYPA